MVPQDFQSSTQGFNPAELSTESSPEELAQEELLTITGGAMGIGAGVGALVGAGVMGGTTTELLKKDGYSTKQSLEYGAAIGAIGATSGAVGGGVIGGVIDK